MDKLKEQPQQVEYVKWSESYSMGIKQIDDQHKGLLAIVNDLFNHPTGNEAEEFAYFKGVIQKAVDYARDHFALEEKYMIATKFPGYAEHRKAHEEFIVTVVKTVTDFEAGKRLYFTNFSHFLKDWVLSHIAVMDKQYGGYFRKIATRKADGKLSITWADISN